MLVVCRLFYLNHHDRPVSTCFVAACGRRHRRLNLLGPRRDLSDGVAGDGAKRTRPRRAQMGLRQRHRRVHPPYDDNGRRRRQQLAQRPAVGDQPPRRGRFEISKAANARVDPPGEPRGRRARRRARPPLQAVRPRRPPRRSRRPTCRFRRSHSLPTAYAGLHSVVDVVAPPSNSGSTRLMACR